MRPARSAEISTFNAVARCLFPGRAFRKAVDVNDVALNEIASERAMRRRGVKSEQMLDAKTAKEALKFGIAARCTVLRCTEAS